jgi:hypothetical protein
VQVEKRRVEAAKEAEARRVARKRAALSDLLVYLDDVEDVEELRRRAEAGWDMESDHAQLQARAVRVCEEALARAQRMLAAVRKTGDTAELRRVGVEAVAAASMDTLCAMTVQAAAQAGVFLRCAQRRIKRVANALGTDQRNPTEPSRHTVTNGVGSDQRRWVQTNGRFETNG